MSAHCCGHDHGHGSSSPTYRRILWIALAVNLAMFAVEIGAGLAAQSVSLLADSLDFLGDAANYGISLFVLGMALQWRARASLIKAASMGLFGLWVAGTTIQHALAGTVPGASVMGVVGALALAGFIVSGVAHRVPVVIDGVIALAAVVVADALVPGIAAHVIAGHRSTEPGASAALEHLGLDMNYTYLDSENGSIDSPEGNQLPLRPKHELFVRPRLYTDWGSVYYEYTYLSENPTDVDNFLIVPPRSIHSLGCAVEPWPWLSVRFEVTNVTDSDVRDVGNFPLPGRSFFGSVKAVF
jgi:hypothetical protein